MTTATIYAATGGEVLEHTEDADRIAALAESIGGRYERWTASADLPAGAGPGEILAAYAADIERLKRERGYTAADVVRLTPDAPNRAELRAKFLGEHTHSDDEVRFFVEGRGDFFLHVDDKVIKLVCERGDLLSVPAGLRHWFDTRENPDFTAIRVFTDPAGWVANFTGDPLVGRFVPA